MKQKSINSFFARPSGGAPASVPSKQAKAAEQTSSQIPQDAALKEVAANAAADKVSGVSHIQNFCRAVKHFGK